MKIHSATFETSAPDFAGCPPRPLPEFAFIGRSNVGKSSLINALAGRRDLARVSATPGKTQLINFYTLNGAWSLVDLPGYGYAEVGRERRLGFNDAVAEFLAQRGHLRCVYVLIDSRLEPQRIDLEFVRWIEGIAVPFALIFTKADKQSAQRTRQGAEAFLKVIRTWRTEMPDWMISSAVNGTGRAEILGHIGRKLTELRPPA